MNDQLQIQALQKNYENAEDQIDSPVTFTHSYENTTFFTNIKGPNLQQITLENKKYEPSPQYIQFTYKRDQYQKLIDKLQTKSTSQNSIIQGQSSDIQSVDQFVFKDQLKILKHIGTGKFSKVYLGLCKISNMLFAIKIITKQTIVKYNIHDQIVNEIKIQQSLNHKNLITLFGYYQDDTNIFLLSQYCEQGEFLQYSQKLNQDQKVVHMKDILQTIDFMHSKKIMHRDLKPENIFVSMSEIKIGDFGCAAPFPTLQQRRTSFCGTIDYLSPEMVTGGGKISDPNDPGQQIYKGYDEKCDIWAYGVLSYEIFTGKTPFSRKKEKNMDIIMGQICKGFINFSDRLSPLQLDLITKCLTFDPAQRPSVNQLLSHDLFQQ